MGQQGPIMLNRAPHTLLWTNLWGAHSHFSNYTKLHTRLQRHIVQRTPRLIIKKAAPQIPKFPLGLSPGFYTQLKLGLNKLYSDSTHFTNLM